MYEVKKMKRLDKTIRNRWAFVLMFIMVLCVSVPGLWAAHDKELFDKARLALFDRKWDKALEQLTRLKKDYPGSRYYSQALFYMGKCYEEKKMPGKALENYRGFIKQSKNETLKEEATISIIDLNFQLYEQGRKKHVQDILAYLEHPERTIRYYAAFKLSYAKDKRTAVKAVPVLERMVEQEEDKELVDRARIALLRIDPEYLENVSHVSSRGAANVRSLSIEVYSTNKKKITFRITIPIALAQVAMDALPSDQKALLKKEGYNFEKILSEVLKKGNKVELTIDDAVFKVWVH